MDRLAKLMTWRAAGRRGGAMASALFAISAAAILTAGVHWMTRADIRTTSNRESSVRALAIAEAGLAHALGLVRDSLGDTTLTRILRGWDKNKNTVDDGLLTGYNLPTGTQIPVGGRAIAGGRYFVQFVDDPGEVDNDPFTDRNTRIEAICRGVTDNGSTAEIRAVVGNASLAGVSINGNLAISGSTTISGRCGGVHTNGNLTLSTTLTVETKAAATGTLTGGTLVNTYGETLPREQGAEVSEFPPLTAAAHCGRADYTLRSDGTAYNHATNAGVAPAAIGWVFSSGIWEALTTALPGSYCVQGDLKLGVSLGTATLPLAMSFFVQGSVQVSGNQFLRSEDVDGILFIADGDVKMNGTSNLLNPDLSGFIYAESQCEMSGQLYIEGQVICRNQPNPVGAEAWVSENKISGTTKISYGCKGYLSQLWRVLSWYRTSS